VLYFQTRGAPADLTDIREIFFQVEFAAPVGYVEPQRRPKPEVKEEVRYECLGLIGGGGVEA
jgi:hypothetical protein